MNSRIGEWQEIIIFCSLTGGGIFTIAGLSSTFRRFKEWNSVRYEMDGQIVPAEHILNSGTPVLLFPASETAARKRKAIIVRMNRRTIELGLETPATTRLHAAAEEHPPSWQKHGSSVKIEIQREDALYTLSAQVQDLRMEDHEWNIQITRPFWACRVQRRQNVRVKMTLPIALEKVDEAGTTQRPRHSMLHDLSAGGFCTDMYCSASPEDVASCMIEYAPGTPLRVRLPLPGLKGTALMARVLAVRRISVPGGVGARLACGFLALEEWEQEQIIHSVFEQQREQLHLLHRQKAKL